MNEAEKFVAIMFYDYEPCRVYGPFDTEDEACEFIDTQNGFGAATVHAIRTPEEH